MRTAGLRFPAAGRGFTLIELLLTVVLLLLLMGAAVINFSSLQSSVQLDEGADQLESAVRFLRAHAASSGCKVRLSFEESSAEQDSVSVGDIIAEWEPDPLRRPGVYERLRDLTPLLESLMQAVQVEDVRALDASGAPAASVEAEDPFAMEDEFAPLFAPIVFFPDGSSDSAEIVLASRDDADSRRIAVKIIGATGGIQKRVLETEERAPGEEVATDAEK